MPYSAIFQLISFNVKNIIIIAGHESNNIFQYIRNIITNNPKITYLELYSKLESLFKIDLDFLSKKQRVSIKTSILDFFINRAIDNNDFEIDLQEYPIKKFNETSLQIIQLNKNLAAARKSEKSDKIDELLQIIKEKRKLMLHLLKMEVVVFRLNLVGNASVYV